MDTLSPARRSAVMRRIRSRDTKPEVALRRALWALGVRGWRVCRRGLPGTPDLAFGRLRVAVFVDSAFWHGRGRIPADPWWRDKLARNRARDGRVDRALRGLGWRVVRVDAEAVLRDPAGAAVWTSLALRTFAEGSGAEVLALRRSRLRPHNPQFVHRSVHNLTAGPGRK